MALDKNAGDSLFGGIKKNAEKGIVNNPAPIKEHTKQPDEQAQARWKELDKVTVLLETEQKEALDRISKSIMKYRSNALKGNDNKERITTNTLIRALIDNFIQIADKIEMDIISSEEEAREWVGKAFKTVSSEVKELNTLDIGN